MRHRRGLLFLLIILLVGSLAYASIAYYEQYRVRQITSEVLERVYVRALRDYYELVNDVWRKVEGEETGDVSAVVAKLPRSPLWQHARLIEGDTHKPHDWMVDLDLVSMSGTVMLPADDRSDLLHLRLAMKEQARDVHIRFNDWMAQLLRDAGLAEVEAALVSSVGVHRDKEGVYFRDFILPQLSLRFDARDVESTFHSQLVPWLSAVLAMVICGLLMLIWYLLRRQDEVVLSERLHSAEQLATLGEMAAGIAHEINNPLAYIDSNLSGLSDDLEALNEFIRLLDSASDHLDICDPFYQKTLSGYQQLNIADVCDSAPVRIRDCLNGVQRIEQIINDMRTLSPDDDETQRIADLNSDLPAVFHIIESRLPDNVELVTRLIDLPPMMCNPPQIAQVVMNILANAVHALEGSEGEITVKQRTEGQNLIITIADNGCGMPPEVLSRIFEPFYTTREKGKGTGIGLALCYKLIREHHGEIAVQSRAGAGTTFSLTIPMRTGDSDNAQ